MVEQKNGSIVRRLVGYGRLGSALAGECLGRLYRAARLHGNLFQASFKLREKRRKGARVIKRYHAPEPPARRALAHAAVLEGDKTRLRDLLGHADPASLLAELRTAQGELGTRWTSAAWVIGAASAGTERSAASRHRSWPPLSGSRHHRSRQAPTDAPSGQHPCSRAQPLAGARRHCQVSADSAWRTSSGCAIESDGHVPG